MASLIFNSFLDDLSKGNIKSTDTFYALLVTVTYTPDKDAHTKRSDVTNEITGTGYTAGGAATALVESMDLANDLCNWTFGDVTWSTSTITNARAAVIYKHRGGASSADELVAYADFGANESSIAADFTAHFTSPLRFQN